MSIDAGCRVLAVSGVSRSLLPTAINTLKFGDYIFADDGNPHRVISVKHRLYKGPIVCLRYKKSDDELRVTPDHLILSRRRPRNVGGDRDWSGIVKPNFERAREMRKNMTPPEMIVWEMVRYNKLGVKFRRQHPFGSYIPDFYSHEVNLALEIDGMAFHGTPEAKRRDALRDELIGKKLVEVLRIPASDVFRNPAGVEKKIRFAINDFYDPVNAQWVKAGDLCVRDIVYYPIVHDPLPVDGEGCRGGVGGNENSLHPFIPESIGIKVATPVRITEISRMVTESVVCDLEVE